ncbi:hypothetical protein CP557_03320 [Natrinema ejinorense]|uniref:Uncharacterized protein n=1 Tax=Natrinema ejinorense TaxID=373386 RepID=A0A2A5QS92_9EURY|nr:hypothetical protein CP557_03320 [Natrinema ejinorense]
MDAHADTPDRRVSYLEARMAVSPDRTPILAASRRRERVFVLRSVGRCLESPVHHHRVIGVGPEPLESR